MNRPPDSAVARSADGSPAAIEEGGDASRARASHEEVTSALRRSEASFHMLIERSPDAIAVYRDGRLIYVNAQSLELLGYDAPAELLGRAVLDLVTPADRPVVAARIEAMIRTGRPAPPRELRFLRKDGSVCFVESTSLVVEFDGAPAVLTIVRDLSERKALEGKVMQMDRMLAVGTLAAGMAHEMNNPLQCVSGNLDFLAQELAELVGAAHEIGSPPSLDEVPARAAELGRRLRDMEPVLGEMREGAARIRTIVRDLRSFARVKDDPRDAIDLAGVVDAAIGFAWNELRHRARLVKRYEPLPPIVTSGARLGQVVLNLLVNAAQAIAVGSAAANEIRVRIFADGGRACVEIEDTGVGIPEEILPRIFDPFFTTKPVGHGSGLGLTVCSNLLRDMDGDIVVRSRVGHGSTFRISVPLVAAEIEPPAPELARTTPGAGGDEARPRVLVIDDEPDVRAALRRLIGAALRRMGAPHECVVVGSGAEALALLRGGARFALLFSDLMMPEMSGMQLYAELTREFPEQAARVVFVTGGAFTPDASDFLDSVPNPRLDKPVDLAGLGPVLRERLR